MAERTCSVEGCSKPHRGRGFCVTHYHRERQAGRLVPQTAAERFADKYAVIGECHIWQATKTPDGYGRFRDQGKLWLAHRWIWSQQRGPIPEDLTVDHLCNTPACVRIEHLQLLPIYDNVMRGTSPQAQNRRKTHCKRGHEFTAENTLITVSGGRLCRTCKREYERSRSRRGRST